MTDSEKDLIEGKILKRDAAGRVHVSAEQRQAVLAQFERSGLSGPQFARVAGIAYQTFATWRRRQGGFEGASTRQMDRPGGPRLIEAVVQPPKAGAAHEAPLLVHLGGGARLEIIASAQVPLAAQLLQALARPC
jgi:DNA-binding transcriptional regulator YiaG